MRARLTLALTGLVLTAAILPSLATQATAPQTYRIDGIHSTLLFRARHMNLSPFYGRFNDVSGSFTIDEQNPANCALNLVVKTASIDSANEKRDRHLSSPDFLNVRQFPTATFKSTSTKKTGPRTFDITGQFTLHGVTKTVTAKVEYGGSAKDRRGGTRAGLEVSLAFKRSDYGMKYMLRVIGDDMRIIAGLSGLSQ